jgi:hypothetical protein
MRRPGVVAAVIVTMLFLASDLNSYITCRAWSSTAAT